MAGKDLSLVLCASPHLGEASPRRVPARTRGTFRNRVKFRAYCRQGPQRSTQCATRKLQRGERVPRLRYALETAFEAAPMSNPPLDGTLVLDLGRIVRLL